MKIIFTPDWFLGKDILIESFSFIVLLAFFFLCRKYYKLSGKKNFFNLASGFLLIALAQLATIMTKLVLYYDTKFTQQIGQLIITYHVVKSVDIFYYAGFFFYSLLTLLGFFVIYRLGKKHKGDFFLVLYFIVISALLGSGFYYYLVQFYYFFNFYYIFHLTVLVLLILIINNFFQIYKKNKASNTKILIAAFVLLALSQVIFIFSKLGVMFAIANFIELIGYIILLVLIIRILRCKK